jgi:hypothetical protein
MIKANLFSFAFDLAGSAKPRAASVKSEEPSDLRTRRHMDGSDDDDRLPDYRYSEGVFWGIDLPC